MTEWTVVVPFKGGTDAKSRLGDPDQLDLALAMALDTVGAALDAGARVVVVTSAPWPLAGVEVVEDPGAGLNAAVAAGIVRAIGPTAVLLGDLPALDPAELRSALDAAAAHPLAFVPDADAVGTVLITALDPQDHRPAFGGASAAAHRTAGYTELAGAWPGLRRDVDLRTHLAGLTRLGPRTAAVLART